MKHLSTKFALTTISIMVVSSIFAFMLANFYYQQKIKPENDAKNTKIAKEMASFIEASDETIESYFSHLATVGYQIYVVGNDGEGNFYGDTFREDNLSDTVVQSVLNGETFHGMANFPQETFVTGFFANELKNTIGVPFAKDGNRYALFVRPNIKLLFSEIHVLLAWLLVGTIIVSIIFVLISAKFLTRPITKLDEATKEIADGNFTIQLAIDRKDELGQLAKSFTHMTTQLAKLDEMKSNFITNVSHDIQTPLANIKGYTDLLQKESITQAEKNDYVDVIHGEITRLSALTKQLLLLASLDQEKGEITKRTFPLHEQIRTVIQRNLWKAEEREVMISLDLEEVNFYGDDILLYNVWENLFINAIKYNVDHGMIDIALKKAEDHLVVIWKDTGIGMDDETIEQMYDRFYREDTSRTRNVSGSGLGLAIVQSIVLLHHGSLTVDSKVNQGTTIKVMFKNENT